MIFSPTRKIALIAAMEREVASLIKGWNRIEREHEDRGFIFYESDDTILVCGGIGVEAARRAAEAAIAIYSPAQVQSVGFAGALVGSLHVGDIFIPSVVLNARDGSRIETGCGEGTLLTFMAVAGAQQKANLASAFAAQAVDMEAAGAAAAARIHGITFGVTKVISDDLHFEMPDLSRFIDSEGRFRTASFAAFAALRPWLWGGVATLAANSRKSAQALAAHLKRVQAEGDQPSEDRAFEFHNTDSRKAETPAK